MDYFNPVELSFDVDAADEFRKLPGNRRMIFCSERFAATDIFSRLISGSDKNHIFTGIENNPSLQSMKKALLIAEDIDPEIIIAIGGGSVLDTAKIVRYGCYRKDFNIESLIGNSGNYQEGKKPLFIAVPTTHGSGSELTMWATVWDKNRMRKHSVSDSNNYPDIAVYDRNLFATLPLSVAISSTLDALSHSFEALWNKNSNPVSDHFAFESIKLIVKNIEKLNDQVPETVRKELILSSMYAGLAFSNTKTAAAHSISYPLTLRYGIPHGIACSMPLFPLLKINRNMMGEKLDRLFMNCEAESIEELEEGIKGAVRGKVPYSLNQFGVSESDLDELVNESFTRERMANNITKLSEADVRNILEEIFRDTGG